MFVVGCGASRACVLCAWGASAVRGYLRPCRLCGVELMWAVSVTVQSSSLGFTLFIVFVFFGKKKAILHTFSMFILICYFFAKILHLFEVLLIFAVFWQICEFSDIFAKIMKFLRCFCDFDRFFVFFSFFARFCQKTWKKTEGTCGELAGNLRGTCGELAGNLRGTCGDLRGALLQH